MLSWLSVIPVIGTIATAVSSYFTRRVEIDLEKYKVNGQVDEARLNAAVQVLLAEQTHLGGRLMKYGFVFPLAGWWLALLINQVFRDIFGWTWNVHTVAILDTWGGWMVAYLFLHTTLLAPRR